MSKKSLAHAQECARNSSEIFYQYQDRHFAVVCGERVLIVKDKSGYTFRTPSHKSKTFKYLSDAKHACIKYVYSLHPVQDRVLSYYLSKLTPKRVSVFRDYLEGFTPLTLTLDNTQCEVSLKKTLAFFESEGFITLDYSVKGHLTIKPVSCLPFVALVNGIGYVMLHNMKVELTLEKGDILNPYKLEDVLKMLDTLEPHHWLNPGLLPEDVREQIIVEYYSEDGKLCYV